MGIGILKLQLNEAICKCQIHRLILITIFYRLLIDLLSVIRFSKDRIISEIALGHLKSITIELFYNTNRYYEKKILWWQTNPEIRILHILYVTCAV